MKGRTARNAHRRVIGAAAGAICVGAVCLGMFFCAHREPSRHFELSGDYAFQFSNTDQIIVLLHDSLTEHASAITLTYTATGDYMDEIEPMIAEMMDLAMYNTQSPKDGDYIRYQYSGYKLSCCDTEEDGRLAYTVTVRPNYYTTLAEEEQVDERVGEILGELELSGKRSDWEKIKAVYDYVCSRVSYDAVHVRSSHYYRDSTAYAALVKGYASCQGYAVAMYRLLREAGVDNAIVTGTAVNELGEEEFHAWNRVELDGVYYNLDATWDAGKTEYSYFMVTDENFLRHEAN